ncbi:MAG: acyl-CoA synthetase [Acidobacteria bacterium]|jgi:acyl-CoA synthetase (AMP-forming)/AMP-acid ligase II|nr:acyl-CoA synthetase [Acidobacteriota bacterium]
MDWNFGDMLDAVGAALGPEDLALAHGDRKTYWPEFSARTNRLARAFRTLGAAPGDKAGFYMRNQPEYMEAMAACFKAGLSPVNVNYRYLDDELVYIIDNSDSTIVFFDSEFMAEVERVRQRLPRVIAWVQIGAGETAPFATNYEKLATEGDPSPIQGKRSGDDIFLLYTGGTTGMPKGVMWTHNIWREASMEGVRKLGGPVPETMAEHVENALTVGRFSRQLPACPLMHGTGWFTAMGAMLNGGAVVTLSEKSKFSPENLWDTVAENGVTSMAIVGDAFAKPMLKALDENPGRWNLSSVLNIISSGVMWSAEVKQGLLKHIPQTALTDSFGASEAVGFGSSITTAAGGTQTSKFEIGGSCKVFTEDDQEVVPGSGVAGFIARGGAVPLGYYKDPEKTAKTYKTIGGMRYAIPGDWCTVEADGTITLLGRGSNCINTAGEKVYPEEVEEALKAHAAVRDALVVGVPDEKWGQAVTAVVSLEQAVSEDELRAFVQGKLARYKSPKRILFKDDLGRASNGKADYKSIKTFALSELGLT